MNSREQIRQNLIAEEGLELHLYKCPADHWTIGVGRNLQSRGISETTAMQMLDEDIDICLAELNATINNFERLPEPVQLTLVDLCFNIGLKRLLGFKKTLKYIQEGLITGNYTKAAVELLDSAYARQVPNRARRNYERLFHA